MQSNVAVTTATHATAGSFVIILVWFLSLVHVTMPDTVAAAFVVVMAPLVHWATLYLVPNIAKGNSDEKA